jgi:hypothetical protein
MAPAEIPLLGRREIMGEGYRKGIEAHAVEKEYFEAPGAQKRAKVKETEGFHPQVISGEIMDPRVDQQDRTGAEI